jgi:hypothetical protein
MFFYVFLVLCFAATLRAQDQANEIVCSSTTACTSGFIPIFSSSGGSAKVSKSLLSQSGSTVSLSANETLSGNLNMAPSTATAGNILKGGSLFLHNFGISNTLLGQNAGNLTMTVGTANNNTAIGRWALISNTTGNVNTATGVQALQNNTTGLQNTATGVHALQNNTTGSRNTAVGINVLVSNINGSDNTGIGEGALVNDCSSPCALGQGGGNAATGTNALYYNTTGNVNTATGYYALINNTTGNDNTAVGHVALYSNTTGTDNTAVGHFADVSTGNLTNATAIGAGAVVNASNKIRLGNSFVTVVEGPPYSVVSDKSKKENFKAIDAEEVLQKVRDLSVTSWNYIGHDPGVRHYGPVAQDFFAAFGNDGLGTIGSPTTITSTDLDGVLLLAVQALEKRMAELATVKAENADLKARLEKLEASGGLR